LSRGDDNRRRWIVLISDDWRRSPIRFSEAVYFGIFVHTVLYYYLWRSRHDLFISPELLQAYNNSFDRWLVSAAWGLSFAVFLLISSLQLGRVYLRVVLSDEIDDRQERLEKELRKRRGYMRVQFWGYVLRLSALLWLLLVEKALAANFQASWVPGGAFYQRWGVFLCVFYALLVGYSLLVSPWRRSAAKQILVEHGVDVGVVRTGMAPIVSDGAHTSLLNQAAEAYLQAAGWFRTDVFMLLAWAFLAVNGVVVQMRISAYLVVILATFAVLLSWKTVALERKGPLWEDSERVLQTYSVIRSAAATIIVSCIWHVMSEALHA
jgi:hypothetical protein